ncbi:MAG: hypothetical protein DBX62_03675 [Clostridia bacterium]|nr:MAG: hypothetical protein DBX62_03675 [Clostridia bacterium]
MRAKRADGGVKKERGFTYLRQPFSQSALRRIASSPNGEPFGTIYKLLLHMEEHKFLLLQKENKCLW